MNSIVIIKMIITSLGAAAFHSVQNTSNLDVLKLADKGGYSMDTVPPYLPPRVHWAEALLSSCKHTTN